MRVKLTESEALIGSDELGFTHLCSISEYYNPYTISKEQAINARSAGVITEEEYAEAVK